MENPIRPQTRSDLIKLVSRQTSSRALKNALIMGKVRLYGGFLAVGSEGKPGWILKVTSQAGKVWLVGIIADGILHRYRLIKIDEVPWKCWDGKIGQTKPDIYSGDEPDEYQRRKVRDDGVEPDWLQRKDICTYVQNRDGIKISGVTAHTWMVKGRIGKDGERRLLKSHTKAGKRFTTSEWIDEFLEAL